MCKKSLMSFFLIVSFFSLSFMEEIPNCIANDFEDMPFADKQFQIEQLHVFPNGIKLKICAANQINVSELYSSIANDPNQTVESIRSTIDVKRRNLFPEENISISLVNPNSRGQSYVSEIQQPIGSIKSTIPEREIGTSSVSPNTAYGSGIELSYHSEYWNISIPSGYYREISGNSESADCVVQPTTGCVTVEVYDPSSGTWPNGTKICAGSQFYQATTYGSYSFRGFRIYNFSSAPYINYTSRFYKSY
ncbi:MAG: hypothetical protein WCJ03_13125 [Bacteroidales bacterium]|jgi:hypothetical protein